MIGVMIAYAIFAASMIIIVVVVLIAAGISGLRRWLRRPKEATKAEPGSNNAPEP